MHAPGKQATVHLVRLSKILTLYGRQSVWSAGLLLFLSIATPLDAQSVLDGFDPNANGEIRVVVVQPDGQILIGGDFTTIAANGGMPVTRNHIARLNPDGKLDPGPFWPNPNGNVWSIALQPDGKILIGGEFTTIGGQSRNHIARVDPVTGAADSFDPNATNDNQPALCNINAIAVQPNGEILVGGKFTRIGGQMRNNIARLNATSGLADSFNPNSDSYVSAIALQSNGRILVGGDFGQIGGQVRSNIARLDPITGLADSFDPDATPVVGFAHSVSAIAVQPDRKILVAGFFGRIGSQLRNGIARLDPSTGLADSFDPNALGAELGFPAAVETIVLQADGKILVAGNFEHIGGQTRIHIARLDQVTGLADSLNTNIAASALLDSIAVQTDGKILAVGNFSSVADETRNNIARLETNGSLDKTLNIHVESTTEYRSVTATAIQPDGKILIGGSFTSVLGIQRNYIARLNVDGSVDMTFDPNADGPINSIVVQTDGKLLVGGYFKSIGGTPRNHLARLDGVTGLPDAFDPNVTGFSESVYTIVIQSDGNILVGGAFGIVGTQLRRGIARIDPITGTPDSFDPSPDGVIYDILVQPDGKIVVAGYFGIISGVARNCIARLDPATGLADSFDPQANITVTAVTMLPDGRILAGGQFWIIGGQTRTGIARLDSVTGLADTFDLNMQGSIWSMAEQSDGQIVAAGYFGSIGGQTRSGFARFDPITGIVDSLQVTPADGNLTSVALQTDGKLLLGGNFATINGEPHNTFARATNTTAALQDLAVTQSAITWTRVGSSTRFAHTTFEYSTDNLNYTLLGNGVFDNGHWTLAGQNLPFEQQFFIRARGFYRTGQSHSSESLAELVKSVFIHRPSTVGNISTRLHVQSGDNAMIGGFIITGTEPKTVVVRGIGPSLPIPGVLADPIIEVHGEFGQLLATNDNWMDDPNQQHVIDSGLAPTNNLESALWGIINPGAYTVVVRGKNDATGIGLFEVYDLDRTADSKLANISTRGVVEVGDNVMIGGTIIIGEDPARILVRAIGPSLTSFGVPNALPNPMLELHDGNGALIASNDNWRSDQEAEIIATGIPPSNDLESAILRDLAPGNYTAITRGVNNTTGVAVVEAYELN